MSLDAPVFQGPDEIQQLLTLLRDFPRDAQELRDRLQRMINQEKVSSKRENLCRALNYAKLADLPHGADFMLFCFDWEMAHRRIREHLLLTLVDD
jgi:hypothetical protein